MLTLPDLCPPTLPALQVKDRQVLDSRAVLNTSSYVNVFFEKEEIEVANMGMRINLADQTVYPESFKVGGVQDGIWYGAHTGM